MKKLLIGLGVLLTLVVLAAVAAVVTPFLIPAETYKARIVAEVMNATGRELRIDGPMTFQLYPQIALTAGEVSFGNAPGGTAKTMARLKSLELRLQLVPLFNGTIAIDSFVMVNPVIALEVDKAGKPNWAFHTPPEDTSKPPSAAKRLATYENAQIGHGELIEAVADLHLTRLEIQNGTVSYADARAGIHHTVSALNMKLAMADLDSPLAVEGSGAWNGQTVGLKLNIARPSAYKDGSPTPMTVAVNAAPIIFAFSGTGAGNPDPKLIGDVSMTIPSVREFAKWARQPLGPVNGFNLLRINGRLDLEHGRYAFEKADVIFDAIHGEGGIQFDNTGARLRIRGSLQLGELDLNPYLASAKPQPAEPAPKPAVEKVADAPDAPVPPPAEWSTAPFNVAPIKLADADFFLGANTIRYGEVVIGKSSVILQVKNGKLVADLTELALYGGSGQGRVVLDGSGAVPSIDQSFNLQGVDIQALLHAADNVTLLKGTGNLTMAVQGSGANQREVIRSLSGKGSLHLEKGAIEGADIVNMVRSKDDSAAGLMNFVGVGNTTEFSSFNATFTIAEGVIKNADLKLDAPDLPITGAGQIDLPRQEVKYRLQPKLAGIVTVPIDVAGPWNNLTYTPDVGDTLLNLIPDWIRNLFK